MRLPRQEPWQQDPTNLWLDTFAEHKRMFSVIRAHVHHHHTRRVDKTLNNKAQMKKTHGSLTQTSMWRADPFLGSEKRRNFFQCFWWYFKHLLLFRICQIISHFCIGSRKKSLWWMIAFVRVKKIKQKTTCFVSGVHISYKSGTF